MTEKVSMIPAAIFIVLIVGLAAGQPVGFAQQEERAAETNERPDGYAKHLRLPFRPGSYLLAPSGKWGLFWRLDEDPVRRKKSTVMCTVDLDLMVVAANSVANDHPQAIVAGDQAVVIFFPEARQLQVMDWEKLHVQASSPVADKKVQFSLFANQYLILSPFDRRKLTDLQPAPSEYGIDRAADWAGAEHAGVLRAGDGWFVDGFVYDDRLTHVTRFCGHPHIFPGTVAFRQSGAPPNVAGRRIAPNLLGLSNAPGDPDGAFRVELVRANSVTLTQQMFEGADGLPDRNNFSTWIRLQAVLGGTAAASAQTSERLLARIRFTRPPEIPFQEFREISALHLASSIGRYCTVIGDLAVVFTFEEECWRRLPRASQLRSEGFPIVVPSDRATTWKLQLVSGKRIASAEFSDSSLRFDVARQEVTFKPSGAIAQLDRQEILQPRWWGKRMSPDVRWEAFLPDAPKARVRGYLEKLAGTPFRVLPVSVPYQISVKIDDGSTAEIAGCFVIDFPADALAGEFEKRQQARRQRLTATEVAKDTVVANSTPMIASDPTPVEKPSDSSESPMPDESFVAEASAPLPPHAPSISADAPDPPGESWFRLLFELLVNGLVSATLGATLLWISCRLCLNSETSKAPPAFGRVMASMLAVTLIVVGLEAVIVGHAREALLVDRNSLWMILGVAFLNTSLVRLTSVGVVCVWFLRLPMRKLGDVAFIFCLMSVFMGAPLVGGLLTCLILW